MALYRYVTSKEELLTAIVERAFEEFELPKDVDADWQLTGIEEQHERTRQFRAHLLTLPPEDFPHVIEAADYLCEPSDPVWAFEMALDLLIGGLEKLLEDAPRPAQCSD